MGNDIGSDSVTGCRLWLLGDLRRHTEPEPMSLPQSPILVTQRFIPLIQGAVNFANG